MAFSGSLVCVCGRIQEVWSFYGILQDFVGEWAPCDQNTAKVVSINEITQMKLINFKSVDNK